MSNEPAASPSIAAPVPLGLAGFAHERRFTTGRGATNVGVAQTAAISLAFVMMTLGRYATRRFGGRLGNVCRR
jgi:hypothetical protein